MDSKDKVENLKYIYSQQHYFIDRHDNMSEKYINTLTFIATALTVLFTLNSDKIKSYKILFVISFGLLFLFLTVAIIKVIYIFNPLSKYFIKNPSKINNKKEYIMKSRIYYRGIINRVDSEGCKKYIKGINEENLIDDLTKQIYILAKYSDEKRKRLDKAKIWISLTILMSLINICLILLFNIM